MPIVVDMGDCCCPEGSGSGVLCACPDLGATITIEFANLRDECTFKGSGAGCPWTGLENTTYTLHKCTPSAGEFPSDCDGRYKLGSMTLCEIFELYFDPDIDGDPCDICPDLGGACSLGVSNLVQDFSFVGTSDCGGLATADVYLGIFVRLNHQATPTTQIIIQSVVIQTDISPPAIFWNRASSYGLGAIYIDPTNCPAVVPAGFDCHIDGFPGVGGSFADWIISHEDCWPKTFTQVAGEECCQQDAPAPSPTCTITV